MSELKRPTDVIDAIALIQLQIVGIAKMTAEDRRKAGMAGGEGVSYAYRGIEQITAELQKLLGGCGVAIVPHRVTCTDEDIEKGGKPWTRTKTQVHWRIYGPGGLTDYIEAESRGIGDDNSDKSENKAFTGAFKNLLLKLFCIGDPSEDTDHANSPVQTQSATVPKSNGKQPEYPKDVVARWKISDGDLAELKVFAKESGSNLQDLIAKALSLNAANVRDTACFWRWLNTTYPKADAVSGDAKAPSPTNATDEVAA